MSNGQLHDFLAHQVRCFFCHPPSRQRPLLSLI
jgi:hypothetical protein